MHRRRSSFTSQLSAYLSIRAAVLTVCFHCLQDKVKSECRVNETDNTNTEPVDSLPVSPKS